jgi:hypothetical protein
MHRRGLQTRTWILLSCAALLALCSRRVVAAARPAQEALLLPRATSITNATTAQILAGLATWNNEVLLAVVRLAEGKALDMVKNWVRN